MKKSENYLYEIFIKEHEYTQVMEINRSTKSLFKSLMIMMKDRGNITTLSSLC